MTLIDLRQAIVNRVQENSKEQLNEVIEGSIGHDERALPGLGVLFEMIWKQSDSSQQTHMVESLYEHLHQEGTENPSPS
ncbi:small acid-soluble spore protein SspI [Paenibacillus sp. GSMTC-2017]|uniref:small acid-soluble spore protein SspI n=1 Tax=Paenibacillus sp. GSMTC-2017 TaxID=2794350 RepID=UPI0018D912DC|nr:small acid-soluble spore protein SspI [Paenibacillus sp. GSMTC-2017]MBH5317548.1 small acid-soluble spore protein SspI [Paenibacillus sp. GSMTC-2017]